MWRRLAIKGLINGRTTASPKFLPSLLHHQVPHHETLAIIEPAFHFSHFSTRSQFYENPRFFSSNPIEDTLSETLISEENESTGVFHSDALNPFDESTKQEIENEDSIFDDADAVDSLEGTDDSGEIFGSVAEGNEVVENEVVGQVKENDREKVESLLSLLQSSGGTIVGSLEANLDEMGIVLDEVLLLKVLETPHVPGENLIGFFSWVFKKPEFKVTTRVLDVLVSTIGQAERKRDVYALWDLLKEVGEKEKGVVSTESLNALIAKLSSLGKAKAAFDVFNKFEEFGCLQNADTFFFIIEALCKRSFYNWASLVTMKMLEAEKLSGVERVGKIISYLCKGGRAKDAHLVYIYAMNMKIYPPRSSVDSLISSLSRIERIKKGSEKEINKELDKETVSLAIEILDDYPAEYRKYAIKPFSSVIKKLCWIEDVGQAKKLLLQMVDSGPPPGNAVFNCVINGLTKLGDMEEAVQIMNLMKSRGLKPDVYTYSVVMSGYARGGAMEEACKIFDEAKKKHSKLCPITYHTLIRGFCKLEQFDKAVDLLREMKQYGVNPSHDEYNKLIKSLCFKALDWETAEKLEEEMKLDGVILNGRTSALISAVKELKEDVNA
ncbi:hypothetical protein ACJIZ3_024637 [Penstemon smallii]|uniref:Pentatricopeptide repeat-containing protein n=1 Tax=Penstemon smallii TaxID=265156 RepID=A0ABD3TU29_9LAMI